MNENHPVNDSDFIETPQDWYFSFGLGDEEHADNHVVINGTMQNARQEMFNRYGSKWAFQYNAEDGARYVEKYHTTELLSPTVTLTRDDFETLMAFAADWVNDHPQEADSFPFTIDLVRRLARDHRSRVSIAPPEEATG